MNRIYKVIWNRSRACWQVVSELAKNNGRVKSHRCRSRRERETLDSMLACRQLAAALAVTLACSLGLAVALAAAAETNATGNLYYGDPGGYPVFATKDTLNTNMGGQYQTVYNYASYLGTYNFTLVKGASGTGASELTVGQVVQSGPAGKTISGKAYPGWAAILGYSKICLKLADGTYADATSYANTGAILDAINTDYWLNPKYAQEIAAAFSSGDLSKLTHLPLFYGLTADGQYELLGSRTIAGSMTNSITQTGTSSYGSVTVNAGDTWRPLDRVKLTTVVSGQYTLHNSVQVGTDGTITNVGYSSPDTFVNLTTGKTMPFAADRKATAGTTVDINNGESPLTGSSSTTYIKVDNLTVGTGGTIDLAYLNTSGSNPLVLQTTSYNKNRTILAENASLADGTVLHFGSYIGVDLAGQSNKTTSLYKFGARGMDQLFVTYATTPDSKAKVYLELGYVGGLTQATQGVATRQTSEYPVFFGILNGAENFTVEGRTTLADGIFSQYQITPVVSRYDNYFTDPANSSLKTGTAWYLDSYSWINLGTASESGRSAADNSVITNNLWKSNYLNMFRRVGSLHRPGFIGERVAMLGDSAPAATNSTPAGGTGTPATGAAASRTLGIVAYPVKEEDQKENAWAEVWHGKYQSSSGYGRRVDQSYNGLQAGYDKLLNHDIHGGKVYTGFFLSKVDGKSNTASGGGDQDSQGLGLYASWVGHNGHYLDAAVMASRLTDKYHLTGNTGSGLGRISGDYSTWACGLGLQYGYQSPVTQQGWYWEPSAALFLGRTNGVSYSLSNDLGISRDSAASATGRLGLKVGKQLAGGKGSVYAGVAALHEFAGGTGLHAFFGNQTMALATASGQDTWWEWSLGGNWKLSPTGVFNLDLNKTTGGDGSDWKVSGGLNWTWGGFWSGGQAAPKDQAVAAAAGGGLRGEAPRGSTALIVGEAPTAAVPAQPAPAATAAQPPAGSPDSQDTTAPLAADGRQPAGETPAASTVPSQPAADRPAGAAAAVDSGEYTFAPVTVEAARPAWESQLSPGQVSVVYPEHFAGEQKDLPDLLDRVPGLFVQRVSGDGHYTVARVRGSTGAQVAVYVDGVLMNLNGEAAVNLSTIPVDNVERIEVYRGYVPARFSGSPLGGVINIVTKKPKTVGGTITQGIKSYGGYTGTYQFTAPAGNGSLLFTWQRDIWGGDFPFTVSPSNRTITTEYGDVNRRSNGYQNENGMAKWQDDHWTVKAAWKDLHEELPRAVDTLQSTGEPGMGGSSGGYTEYFHKGYYDAEQDIRQREFQIGRRDTAGSLDWGWKAYYLNQKKDYRNTGIYKYGADTGTDVDKKYDYIPGFLWTKFDSDKWGFNLNGSLKMGGSHLVEVNFDYSNESLDADGSHWTDWNQSAWVKNWNRQYIHHYKIQEYHLTLQDSITLNQAGDFKLTPVLRADRVVMSTMAANDKKWQYSGAAALQKQLDEHWSVRTNWGTYNRHPNFYELFGDGATIAPNEQAAKFFDLDGQGTWESGHQFDFSVNWQGKLARADTGTSLTWFQRRSRNQFALWQPNVPNAPGSYFPMDDARVHGLELTHTMKWRRVSLDLSGTWQKSEYTDNTMGGILNGRKSVISYTPEWAWNARLDYLFPGDKLDAFAEYHYTGKQFTGTNTDKDYDTYLDALATVNLGAKYSFGNGWKLTAGVDDIFNKGYEARQLNNGAYSSTRAYPLPGRMYYATMEYKF
ncbi:Vitamin B12 transporter BtuB [Sporomusa acidovorans DSM 3132]|uniref:Vitamin B12 transporter BtuB n=1 Tax=Sporomusa acidovorans (strain ATCC 49682 / DSM 3132 / Mol) TaxID=1123286 RepID=A0ABZ3J5L6_SPOA4|nr:pertactin autotransporter precursor [Sporomusa acidovorans DSM 3132]SDF31789.1 outer membrane autotransporter barrel domain-containing protein [Sporomusa acidovorans]